MQSEFTVLVVEDEPLVRMLGVDILEEAGFSVVEAGNAAEALETLEGDNDVRVLFTDVNMPGELDGLELARVVHERWPEIRVLIASGQVRPCSDEIPGCGRFLPKPYKAGAVIREIREMTRSTG